MIPATRFFVLLIALYSSPFSGNASAQAAELSDVQVTSGKITDLTDIARPRRAIPSIPALPPDEIPFCDSSDTYNSISRVCQSTGDSAQYCANRQTNCNYFLCRMRQYELLGCQGQADREAATFEEYLNGGWCVFCNEA
jgi:hypothetical protein